MTLIIGIQCDDGIVMAADSMATEAAPIGGELISKHQTDKLMAQGNLLWAASGSTGIKQLVQNAIGKKYKRVHSVHSSAAEFRVELVDLIRAVVVRVYNSVRETLLSMGKEPSPRDVGYTGFLFGAHFKNDGFKLLNIEADMQGEVVDSVHFALGVGQKTGQALLRRLRKQEWDLGTAEVVAFRTMDDAIHVEPYGIGPPIKMARYTLKDGQPVIEAIVGDELKRIRDTARIWTEVEQESLASLGSPPAPGAEDIPVPPSDNGESSG